MNINQICFLLLCLFFYIKRGEAIYCYRCTSATPGCNDNFNWRGIGIVGHPCPEDNDICVKITERKGASTTIIRDCYSSIKVRPDIPPDHYEGCRPAVLDTKLANYVNNSIKEYDIRRDYFDQTEYCFCFLDHRCNNAKSIFPVKSFIFFVSFLLIFFKISL